MTDLETKLRQVAFSEPPLGFDPDDVATKAGKRLRNRRVTIAAVGVTLALAGAAVAAQAPLTRTPPATQEPPTYLPPVVIPKLPQQEQSPLEKLNMDHLLRELPGLLAGARTIVVDGFFSMGGELHPDEMSATVAFVDHEGKGHSFNLAVMGPGTVAKNMLPLTEVCPSPDGSQRCLPQPDGSTVVISGNSAVHYRADATAVSMSDMGRVSPMYTSDLGLPPPSPTDTGESSPSMDDQHLIALVTQRGFHTR